MKHGSSSPDALFLGLDLSTQGLKATVIDRRPDILHESSVNFDVDLPEFGTHGGVHRQADGLTVTSPPLMWVAALDKLLERIGGGMSLQRVFAVSGSGQQHGSVWLKPGTREVLGALDARAGLRTQLAGVFSVNASPVWMDASTSEQCREREEALGGPQAVADLTGSRAYERFTGNQVAKIYRTRPGDYAATERVALVSSFMASLLVGDYVAIDWSDGAGMNLMNLRTKAWSPEALDVTAPGLGAKLGRLVPSHHVVGTVHAYYREKYGFGQDSLVVAFSGDNPNSLAGLRLQRPGDMAVSLGTSDTMFGTVRDPRPSGVEGHVFANPVDPDAYMATIVRLNGSLARERARDRCAGGSWATFGRVLAGTPPGNGGRVGFYFDEPEITPPVMAPGAFRFDAGGSAVGGFDPETEIRALVEGQFLAMRLHGAGIGLEPANILATGGASANEAILQVIADVFGLSVSVAEKSDSASLGAAYRALHGWTCAMQNRFVPYADVLADAPSFRNAAVCNPAAHAVYSGMLDRYAELETRVVTGQ